MGRKSDYVNVWDLFRSGDANAFKQIYDFYYHRLLNYGLKFTRNQATVEDAVQDLFTKLWNNRDTLNSTDSVKNYLYKAFRHTMYSKMGMKMTDFEETSKEDIHEFDFQVSYEQVKIEEERLSEIRIKVQQAMQSMNNRQKEILYLRFYEDLSYPEIAELMDLSVKSTYKLVYRALDNLKELLGGVSMIYLCSLLRMSQIF